MKTIIMFLLILFYAGSLNSQYKNLFPSLKNEIVTLRDSSESGIVITKTDECNIFLKDRSKLTEVQITGLIDSTVKVETDDSFGYINIKNINKIIFPKSSDFLPGALIGAAISLTYWGFVSMSTNSGSESQSWAMFFGILSIVPGGLIGGLIGIAATPDDYVYDFSRWNPDAKLKRLRYIINKHTPFFR